MQRWKCRDSRWWMHTPQLVKHRANVGTQTLPLGHRYCSASLSSTHWTKVFLDHRQVLNSHDEGTTKGHSRSPWKLVPPLMWYISSFNSHYRCKATPGHTCSWTCWRSLKSWLSSGLRKPSPWMSPATCQPLLLLLECLSKPFSKNATASLSLFLELSQQIAARPHSAYNYCGHWL